jgi:hypothetical protein
VGGRLPAWLAVVPIVVAAAALSGGCARSHFASRAEPASSSAAPAPQTPAEHCVSELTFWVPKVLAHDPSASYGDYQDLGLTAAEYGALNHVVARTRAAMPGPWTARTQRYVAAQAAAACADVRPAATPSSGYGWPTS